MAFMQDFHSSSRLPKNAGASSITLIPMKDSADYLKDFRPNSLLRSIYKILAKVLAGRLRKVLHFIIISQSQGAFIHGRQILDRVLIANKCINSRSKDKIPGLLYKLDLEKAYNRVD